MRVAMLVHKFPVVSETFIVRQITGLLDRGHSVEVFAGGPDLSGKVHPDVRKYGLMHLTRYRPWVHEDYHLVAMGDVCNQCYKQAQPLSYDVIHCQFGPMGITGALLREAGFIEGTLVTSFYGFDLSSFPSNNRVGVYDELFRRGDGFTANSRYLVERALALGCNPMKMQLLHVGLDVSKYQYRLRERVSGGPVRMLTIGRLVEKKGIEFAIRAMGKIADRYPDLEYDVIGDGPLRHHLENVIADLNLDQRVRMLGYQEEQVLTEYYKGASFFVLPSVTAANGDQEGMGLVLLEAQAMGLPVVATQHDGIPEGVVEGLSAVLVPERNPEALAEALESLLIRPESWGAMGGAGRAHVEAHFEIDRLNDDLVRVYKAAMSV